MKEKKKTQKKSPNIAIIVGVVLVLLILGAISLNNKRKKWGLVKDDVKRELNGMQQEIKDEMEREFGSDFDFQEIWRNRKGAYHCTYAYEAGDNEEVMNSYKMDYYFADQKLAIFTDSNGHQMNTIVLEDFTYTWTNDSTQGFKMRTEQDDWEEESEDIEADLADYSEMDDFDVTKFKCETWRMDDQVFSLPTNIEFMDMNSYTQDMEDMAEQMESGEIDMEEFAEQMQMYNMGE